MVWVMLSVVVRFSCCFGGRLELFIILILYELGVKLVYLYGAVM